MAFELKNVLLNRRTIHQFREDEVPERKLIMDAIDCARWAPNHHQTEPWFFYLPGTETVNAIIELNTVIVEKKLGKKAALIKKDRWSKVPGWLILTSKKSDDAVRSQEDYAACCCAAQNLMLYLWDKGVGVKWTTGEVIREPDFYNLITADMLRETVVGLFWYGYAEKVPAIKRKTVDEITCQLP